MDLRGVVKSQYRAALAMLRQAVERCPEPLWDDRRPTAAKNRFWHVAYHALFYTHLYLQERQETFVPWAEHRKNYSYLGRMPMPPHEVPEIGEPYTPEQILAYWDACEQEVERVDSVDLEGGSGFSWLPFGKLELQLYNLRHLQQHTGELMERLGTQAGVDVDWVGRG